MNSVNNGDRLREVTWCDHAALSQTNMFGPPVLFIIRETYLVVEEGKVKLVCKNCFRESSTRFSPH